MQSIVVGYDGSDASRRALGRAADLADEGATVFVVHAAPSVYPGSGAAEVPDPAEERRSKTLLDEATELLAKRGVTAETRTATGGAADALVDIASEAGADVVIVGRRNSAVAHILGSVSSDVVERSPCDVLVVH